MNAGDAPVFLLSFRQRDELKAMTERCGWSAVGARRAEAAERRFVGSGAAVAVVDARGAFADGLGAVTALADPVQANGAALLVLVSRGDIARLDEIHAAGATHYLASPFGEAEYGQALRFAARHAERVGAPYRASPDVTASGAADAFGWRWTIGDSAIRLSPALARVAGLDAEVQPLARVARRLGARTLKRARAATTAMLAGEPSSAFAHDGAGGRVVHHLQLGADYVGAWVEELEDRSSRLAATSRDALTGLADAAAARRWLDNHLRLGTEGSGSIALLLVSASRFEMVNTAFGRETGDALLRAAARRIERLASDGRRLVARMAGTEFLVALAGPVTIEEATFLGHALVDAISRPFVAGEQVVSLGAHVGIALSQPGDAEASVLLRRASGALADARSGDGDPVRALGPREGAAAAEASRLEVELRTALAEDEIELLYQPQLAVSTGRIVGVEALARWRHPRLGTVGAEALFAAAERSGYIVQLSQHIQRKVVAEVATWPPVLGTLRVAINVTAGEMAQPDFAANFLAMLDDAGVERRRVTCEVTESGLIDNLDLAADLLARLRAAGLSVAIDDFGTGYSSLAYLKALPLDYLKIDKNLTQDIVGSARDRVVVRSVIDMARSLGLAVVAEGVETTQQLTLLAQEGCNLYQGYVFAPPLNGEALVTMVSGWQVDAAA